MVFYPVLFKWPVSQFALVFYALTRGHIAKAQEACAQAPVITLMMATRLVSRSTGSYEYIKC